MRHYLKAPHGRGCSFRITLNHKAIKNDALDAVNQSFQEGKLSREDCIKTLKELVRVLNLSVTEKRIFNSDNERIVIQYWNKVYSTRDLVDPASSRWALDRAVRAIEALSLATASYKELQDAVNTLSSNKQRRVVQSLNQLLKFLNRDFKLHKARPIKQRVKYLTEKELKLMLPHLPSEPIRLLHQVAFYTGARIGELFAIEASHINVKNNRLSISEQVDKQGELRETKTRTERFAWIEKKAIPIIKRWILAKNGIDSNTRHRMAKITRRACIAAFSGDVSKYCKFHDMRHSYAINLLNAGVGLYPVSKCLGNSQIVCEKYYLGFELTNDTLRMISSIMTKKRRKTKKLVQVSK